MESVLGRPLNSVVGIAVISLGAAQATPTIQAREREETGAVGIVYEAVVRGSEGPSLSLLRYVR